MRKISDLSRAVIKRCAPGSRFSLSMIAIMLVAGCEIPEDIRVLAERAEDRGGEPPQFIPHERFQSNEITRNAS